MTDEQIEHLLTLTDPLEIMFWVQVHVKGVEAGL